MEVQHKGHAYIHPVTPTSAGCHFDEGLSWKYAEQTFKFPFVSERDCAVLYNIADGWAQEWTFRERRKKI